MPEPVAEHLALIQAVITRMAGNSFLLKGWAVTLAAGLTALAKTGTHEHVAWIACGVVVVFAFLDAMYLATERAFRTLYDNVIAGAATTWSLAAPAVSVGTFFSALLSWSVLPLYGAMAIGAGLIALGV
jgi:hypothetical protein